jgi:two-component system OmpR family sensor kinase
MVLGVVVLGALVLRQTQQSFLTSEMDSRLSAARPLARFPPPGFDDDREDRPQPEESFSTLFVGNVDDGELVTVLRGQLLDDTPALDTSASSLDDAVDDGPFTVDGRRGSTRFRVEVVRPEGSDLVWVVALSLDELDAAMSRLTWALVGGTVVIAAFLALAGWWVERLGLGPVARLTAAADAVAGGARSRRVTGADPRTEAGKLSRAFNVMLDQRDATEERLRQFVADASHELRTPLTSIRGYLDLYREGGFRGDGELDDIVRRMSNEASRMHDLVEDLLLLAKLEQHRPLRRERVDVGLLMHNIATDARALQPDRRIVVDAGGDQPLDTVGDTYRLQQAISALVTNALVHTHTGAWLHLAARRTRHSTEITVEDSGPGLGPADATRVFDRFYRGDHSRARRTGGSGLGLAIAKSIVEAHGGTISLHTALGQGCRFVITLPHADVAPDHEPAATLPPDPGRPPHH